MRTSIILVLALGAFICSSQALADDNCGENSTTVNFMRSDLVKIKKQVGAIAAALGNPPAPYSKESDNWQLPTFACKDKTGFQPVVTEYSMHLTTDAQQKKIGKEYQKKLMAAEASGNMQEVMKITQEYQKLAMQQASANQDNSPIDVDISVNNVDSGTLDPGAVLRDGKGFIALKQPAGSGSDYENVTIFFDKVALKNAQQAASFTEGYNTVPGKFDLIHARINLSGPKAQVEHIVKHMNAGAVLGQLSAKRTAKDD